LYRMPSETTKRMQLGQDSAYWVDRQLAPLFSKGLNERMVGPALVVVVGVLVREVTSLGAGPTRMTPNFKNTSE